MLPAPRRYCPPQLIPRTERRGAEVVLQAPLSSASGLITCRRCQPCGQNRPRPRPFLRTTCTPRHPGVGKDVVGDGVQAAGPLPASIPALARGPRLPAGVPPGPAPPTPAPSPRRALLPSPHPHDIPASPPPSALESGPRAPPPAAPVELLTLCIRLRSDARLPVSCLLSSCLSFLPPFFPGGRGSAPHPQEQILTFLVAVQQSQVSLLSCSFLFFSFFKEGTQNSSPRV